MALKRLNRREYANTVRDLLYLPSVDMSAFPPEAAAEGFDTVPSGLYMTDALVDAYWNTSRSLIAQALSGVGGGSGTVELDLEPQSPSACVVVAGWANICSESTITNDVDLPFSDRYTIAVRAYGVEAGGEAPNMRVTVDGGSPHDFSVTASAEAPEVVEFATDLTAGSHRIAIALTNDYYAPPENRDLRVDWLRVTAARGEEAMTNSRERILICSPSGSDDETCARLIVTNFVSRAWRRPIQSEDDIAAMMRVFSSAMDAGNEFEASIALALRAALMSPGFVFRPEFDDVTTDGLGRRYLDGYELASRLSYAIWSSMPDDELFALAGDGELVDPTVLEAQVERMIASPKAVSLIEGFVPQWLEIETLAVEDRDASLFPTYQTVRPHMSDESIAFFSSFLTERKDVRELVDADYGYINEALAEHYGIPGVTGPEFRRVAYDGERIGGILGQASVLTKTSGYAGTSPVRRGKFVLDRILCRPPLPVPPGVPPLPDEPEEGVSKRREFEQHDSDPACRSCHGSMDPIGFALDNFGPTGQWRELDDYGFSIDASGEIPGLGSFSGPREMIELIENSPEFPSCLNSQLFRYLVGRSLTSEDDCQFEILEAQVQEGNAALEDMIKAIVLSDAFRATTTGNH